MVQSTAHAHAKRSSVRAPAPLEPHNGSLRAAPLATLTLGAAAETRLTHEPLLQALLTSLEADHALFYVVTRTPNEQNCIVRACTGDEAGQLRQRFEQAANSGASLGYDPFAIPSAQQNRALSGESLLLLDPAGYERAQKLCASLGHEGCSFLRLVICDGPRQLGGVLMLRATPFSPHEVALLQTRAAPLIAQLNRERAALLAGSSRSLVQALLESFAEPALLLSPPGVVEFANQAGIDWLNGADRETDLAAMRSAMTDGSQNHPGFVLTSLDAVCHGYFLVRLSHAARNSPTQVVALAQRAWRLVDLQAQVLERVANGQSNKEIAAALGRAEVTIERHLTRLFRVSGSRCRTELITRLYSLAP